LRRLPASSTIPSRCISPSLALRKIENLVRTGGNAFGHENITCAVREGKVVGVLIMQTAHSPGLGKEFSVIGHAAGPVTAARYLLAEWLIFAPHYLKGAPEPEYYISSLSVIPAERGRGVGTALLQDVVRKARACSIKITFGSFTTMRRFSGITILSGARIRRGVGSLHDRRRNRYPQGSDAGTSR
jgi:Acetyltransferases